MTTGAAKMRALPIAILALTSSSCIPDAPTQCGAGYRTDGDVCVFVDPATLSVPGVTLDDVGQWVQDAQDAYGHQLPPGYRVYLQRSQDTVSAAALREYDLQVDCLSGYNDDVHMVTLPGAFIHELAHREIAAEGIDEPGYVTDTVTGEYVDTHTPEYGWTEQRLRRIRDAVRAVGNAPGGAGMLCRKLRN